MNPFHYIKRLSNALKMIRENVAEIMTSLHKIQVSLGRIEGRQLQISGSNNLKDNEYRVFSQWGEDGIIQYLIRSMEIKNKIFVEFGVQNYTESNTRFLLINNNWSGLVIDSDKDFIKFIKNDAIYWQHNLKAVCEFITKDNINNIMTDNGISGEIGLLSIDIDGNDYWVWSAINTVEPAIVVIEYNHRFGSEKAVTIPYSDNFVRTKAHCSSIYYGASLKALCLLGFRKGYSFVGCNTAGNNAFFVRKDLKPDFIKEPSVAEGFVAGQFRESRNADGQLLYLSAEEEQKVISSLPLIEIR